ncbi:MAG TPA: hypothetical protein EYP14_19630 [Planctomycetaceae bacterium]|nr:hypothetical protein [Planctomycetaceae bacterium]
MMTRTLCKDRSAERRYEKSSSDAAAPIDVPRVSQRGTEVLTILNHIFDALSDQRSGRVTSRQ